MLSSGVANVTKNDLIDGILLYVAFDEAVSQTTDHFCKKIPLPKNLLEQEIYMLFGWVRDMARKFGLYQGYICFDLIKSGPSAGTIPKDLKFSVKPGRCSSRLAACNLWSSLLRPFVSVTGGLRSTYKMNRGCRTRAKATIFQALSQQALELTTSSV